MIKIYMQTHVADHCELIATAESDEVYKVITPALEAYAKANRAFIWEKEI